MELQIPDSVYTKVKEQLYSEIEGKVPFGAMSRLGEQLFTEWLRSRGVNI